MNKKLLALATLSLFGGVANAQADESRCRSDQSPYYAYGSYFGTVSGYDNDIVIIKNSLGVTVSNKSIGWWKANSGYHVYDVVVHSGGQTSIRFAYFTWASLSGGSVEVRRNGVTIDHDPLL